MAFCKNFFAKIKRIYSQIDDALKQYVPLALTVTRKIKEALQSPAADLIEQLIPGDVDKTIRSLLIKGLDYAITSLLVVDECNAAATLEEKLACYMKYLQKLSPDARDAALIKLASLISKDMHGHQLKQHVYDLFTQGKFSEQKPDA
ncbi:MAG: hypothetical protein EKK37_17320 [Sphingobacteriales bacterium]|nr:MAG: hypothetical protein EKK37_17320 [Sphingobacteriales bacterium]